MNYINSRVGFTILYFLCLFRCISYMFCCRYLNVHLSSTLTVKCRGKVGRQLKSKLRFYMRPKCHPIFYDSNINSPGVVRLNMYQAFLLCAMKFVCYTSNLSILPKFRPEFYINSIEDSLRYEKTTVSWSFYSSFRIEYLS